jgi:hypothetical protein
MSRLDDKVNTRRRFGRKGACERLNKIQKTAEKGNEKLKQEGYARLEEER